MEEVWKDIVGFEGFYQVSSAGRVRSLPHIRRGINGHMQRSAGKIRKASFGKTGYNFVTLCKYGVATQRYVHRLVAAAFIPNEYNKPQVNHKDGNKDNNAAVNLEWATAKENTHHGIRNGLNPANLPGSANPMAKLTEAQIPIIRQRLASGEVQRRIAEDYGVGAQVITEIKQGNHWKHVK